MATMVAILKIYIHPILLNRFVKFDETLWREFKQLELKSKMAPMAAILKIYFYPILLNCFVQ